MHWKNGQPARPHSGQHQHSRAPLRAYGDGGGGGKRCLNCGQIGHVYRTCPQPLVSYGVILFRSDGERLRYLMMCRRHTFGFVELVRGNLGRGGAAGGEGGEGGYVEQLLSEMTADELDAVATRPFEELWRMLWVTPQMGGERARREFERAEAGFQALRESEVVRAFLRDKAAKIPWRTPEWGFPKGKRNKHETGEDCAKREMLEETNVRERGGYRVLPEFASVSETFRGTDDLVYQHNYIVAETVGPVTPYVDEANAMQTREVSAVAWFTFDECMAHIRGYNTAKRQLLRRVDAQLRAAQRQQQPTYRRIRHQIHVNLASRPHVRILDQLEAGEGGGEGGGEAAVSAAAAGAAAASAAAADANAGTNNAGSGGARPAEATAVANDDGGDAADG